MKPGNKEAALREMREEHADLSIPSFLKRTEDKAKKKAKAKPDGDPGVTLAPPLAVQKAIAKDLALDMAEELAADSGDQALAKKLVSLKQLADGINADTAKQEEKTTVSKTSSKKAKAKGKAKAKAKARSKTERKAKGNGGGKTELIGAMLVSIEGCTTKDILKATGWPSVSVPALAKANGLKLKKEKLKGEPTRYYGTPV